MRGLELNSVTIHAGEAPLFAPLTLTVPPSTVTTIVGPSGIGKSTLMDFIGGHLARGFHATGTVILDGQDVTRLPAEARRIGILFQDAALFPHLSVGDNLAFGLASHVRGRAMRRASIETALDKAGLAGFADRDPVKGSAVAEEEDAVDLSL